MVCRHVDRFRSLPLTRFQCSHIHPGDALGQTNALSSTFKTGLVISRVSSRFSSSSQSERPPARQRPHESALHSQKRENDRRQPRCIRTRKRIERWVVHRIRTPFRHLLFPAISALHSPSQLAKCSQRMKGYWKRKQDIIGWRESVKRNGRHGM